MESSLITAPCRGDAAALTILVTNLISNALQYGGNVKVTSGVRDEKTYLSVSDDGPGISQENLPHIFERFYRADQARTGSSGHSGLGLAIAKAIVDNHGATIQVTSLVGQGACFEVEFPHAG